MMTKAVIYNRISDKRKKWDIFEELQETNENLDSAISILIELKKLIKQLPNKLTRTVEQADALLESVMLLDELLEDCIDTATIYFDDIETKLDDIQKFLLHDEACETHKFLKLASGVRSTQKHADTVIANAEAEIYKFLESEDLCVNRQIVDARIMGMVLNS